MNKFVVAARIIAAVILLQTLFYKFTGAPESIYIFQTLGVEPWGRWFAGVSELIAALMLVIPRAQAFGALMVMGVMSGAILSHFFFLGIEVQGDGGLLFALAWITFLLAGFVAWSCRKVYVL